MGVFVFFFAFGLGLNVKQGLASFSLATFFQGITGISTVLLLYALLR